MDGWHGRRPVKRRWPNAFVTLLIDGMGLPWMWLLIGSFGPCGGEHQTRCTDDGRNMLLGLVVVPFVLAFVGFNIAMLIDWVGHRRGRPSADGQDGYPAVYPPPPQWARDSADERLWRWWDGHRYTHHTAWRDVETD